MDKKEKRFLKELKIRDTIYNKGISNLPDCETCKKCGTNNCGNDTTNLQCYEPN